jgi:transmembrane sensor
MDTIPPSHGRAKRALGQAEDWFARLRTGDCGPAERARFERWLADPEHAQAYRATRQLWEDLAGLAGEPALEAMVEAAVRAAPAPRRTFRHVALALAACLALAVLGLAGWRWSGQAAQDYATGPRQRETVRLDDGSLVTLNTGSRIQVALSRGARNVALLHGEALFQVAHDAARPFRVRAGAGEVVALGTRFEVSMQPADRVSVTLIEGSVSVAQRADRLRLQPGQQAVYADTGGISVRDVDVDVVSGWARGRLLFRSVPLPEVVEEVNRYATRPLRLDDPALSGLEVSGTFVLGDSESVALGLQSLLPVRADLRRPDSIVLTGRR